MFLRLLFQSFRRQKRRKLLAGLAVMIGVAVATAMLAVSVDVGDKINRELRSYGANLVVYPEDAALTVNVGDAQIRPASGSLLDESRLPNVKGMFWGHNILAYAPWLETRSQFATGSSSGARQLDIPIIGTYFEKAVPFGKEEFVTGVRKLYPWWQVNGDWPRDDASDALVGTRLAAQLGAQPGSTLHVDGDRELRVAGIVTTGGAEDNALIVPLHFAQELAKVPGRFDKLYVSALTKLEDAFARRDPDHMSPADRDRWYCSPYANSIAFQLQEVFPGSRAEQIRQAAQNEGPILSHISGMMLLIAFSALAAAVLAVSGAMATTLFERRHEVGLMKSLGATATAIATLFLTEASLLALAAGACGFLIGDFIAQRIGRAVFNSPVSIAPVLLPIVLALAVAVTIAGSAATIRRALRLDPVIVLRGDA